MQIEIRGNSGKYIGYIRLECGTAIWADYLPDINQLIDKLRHQYGTMLQRSNDLIVCNQCK